MEIEIVRPEEIEKRSFSIISEELKAQGITLPEDQEAVTKRCIHTSADFDYARNLTFSEGAVEKAKEAIRHGASLVTDTQMARSGINKRVLEQYGGQVYCFMSDTDVAEAAKRAGTTRAVASMEKACALEEDLIFAIGNAPTALIRLYELIREGRIAPKLVIGAPVGFVNVVQSKEQILTLKDTPYIVARGRKGGSGTFPIEAAMMAANMAPGMNREFLSESWGHLIPKKCWYDAANEAGDLVDLSVKTDIQGYDIDGEVIRAARANAKSAGVEELIHFQTRPVSQLSHPKKYGFIVTNPPYGERIEEKKNLPELYRTFGERFAALDSWSAYVITAYEDMERHFGRKAAKNRKIYNGMMKTYFYQFPGPKPPARPRQAENG